jgi:protein-tyrosine phosphatase
MADHGEGYPIDSNIDSNYLHSAGGRRFTDIHCHCLPSLDDGPLTTAESVELCRLLTLEGITTAVATPHQLGRFDGSNEAAYIRQAVADLMACLAKNDVPLDILPGAEVRVDERICRLLEADKILTLADRGRYVLLELPNGVFIDIEPLLVELSSMGYESIIAHAERIAALEVDPQLLPRWLRHSTHLQITASSLSGDFGPDLQQSARSLLTGGWATLVASDSHDTGSRRPQMKAAFKRISAQLGQEVARLVCIGNPSRVIANQDILPLSVCGSKEADR